ncbi:MAG: M1 family metallopeptidase [Vicinamibacteria bacterium]|nr:M1 family metallopeptidase [Vicinamibacteria bacterium]
MKIRRFPMAGLSCGLLVLAGVARADTYPRQPGVDILHYAFHLTLSDETDSIEGEAKITLRVAKDGVNTLTLDLVQPKAEAQNRGMTVSAVTEAGKAVTFEHANDRLTLRLDPAGRAGETRTFAVRYHGIPATGLLIAPNKHGERTFFSDNWPIKARQWLPTLDHPYDKATTEMFVTAPAHYQVVSNGLRVEEIDLDGDRRLTHWRNSVPIATWLNVLGAARFAVDHRAVWRGLPIETWVYRQDRDNGFAVFANPTPAVLDFLSDKVGPYSFERLANVQANGVRGGMESATSIFYGDDSVNDPSSTRWRNVIIHETAHQWFGNAVTENDWDHVWLSEGFATYFTHLFVEHAYGRDEFIAGLRADRDAIREFDAKNPNYRIIHDNLADMSQVLSSAGTYKKGGWTLHMLRGLIGDAAFWSGIREYYKEYRDGNAATVDFRRVMEEASGKDLGWFFDQWLTRGGFLKVRAQWSYDEAAKVVRIDVEQLQPGAPLRMPIEVGLEVAGEVVSRTAKIEVRNRKDSLSIPLDRAPRGLTLDPRTFVLMDAEVAPAPSAVRR